MGRGTNVQWRRAGREALRLLALSIALGGCRDEVPTLRVVRRVPLPAPGVEFVESLPGGEAYVGAAGRVQVLDSLGRVRRELRLPGPPARLLGRQGGKVVLALPAAGLAVVDLDSAAVVAGRRASGSAPAAVDPRGRWIYTTHAWGSVLGLDSALVPRWGWPDAGARASALAVGPLADRVYLGLGEGEDWEAAVQVLDAWTGRVLGTWEAARPPLGLATSSRPDVLYAWDADGVLALRHAGETLLPQWRAQLDALGMDSVTAVRPSPDGGRLAVVGRREGRGRLAVLRAETGRQVARWNGSPPDAAWDARGLLILPEEGALLWLR